MSTTSRLNKDKDPKKKFQEQKELNPCCAWAMGKVHSMVFSVLLRVWKAIMIMSKNQENKQRKWDY